MMSLTWYWHEVQFCIVDLGRMSCYWLNMEYEWGMVTKGWYEIDVCDEYYVIDWICIVCGQYIIPWNL